MADEYECGAIVITRGTVYPQLVPCVVRTFRALRSIILTLFAYVGYCITRFLEGWGLCSEEHWLKMEPQSKGGPERRFFGQAAHFVRDNDLRTELKIMLICKWRGSEVNERPQ